MITCFLRLLGGGWKGSVEDEDKEEGGDEDKERGRVRGEGGKPYRLSTTPMPELTGQRIK